MFLRLIWIGLYYICNLNRVDKDFVLILRNIYYCNFAVTFIERDSFRFSIGGVYCVFFRKLKHSHGRLFFPHYLQFKDIFSRRLEKSILVNPGRITGNTDSYALLVTGPLELLFELSDLLRYLSHFSSEVILAVTHHYAECSVSIFGCFVYRRLPLII